MSWLNPLGNIQLKLPPPHGRFGAVRKHDVHTGIDLYAPHGSNVYVVESGVVVAVDYFTGSSIGMPWWNETRAVLIEGESGVVCYGEIQEIFRVKVGMKVKAGDFIATVLTVLKKDKGLPMSMLHLELHAGYDKTNIWHPWNLNEPKPEYLLDPYNKLKHLFL